MLLHDNPRKVSARTHVSDGTLFVRKHPTFALTRTTTGGLLEKWVTYIANLRGTFKIGITSNPVRRSHDKARDGSSYRTAFRRGNMIVLANFRSSETAAMAEAALILCFWGDPHCLNRARGGDGVRSTTTFLYVVVEEGNTGY